MVRNDPFGTPPSYEALVGTLTGMYSRRINLQHRLVYMVREGEVERDGSTFQGVVKVVRMWTHYEDLRRVGFNVGLLPPEQSVKKGRAQPSC